MGIPGRGQGTLILRFLLIGLSLLLAAALIDRGSFVVGGLIGVMAIIRLSLVMSRRRQIDRWRERRNRGERPGRPF
jgi:hypothetical protein